MKPPTGVTPSPAPTPALVEREDFHSRRTEAAHRQPSTSRIHFSVHAGMRELQEYAGACGWTERGFTQLSVPWQELRYTTDGWKTQRSLKSTDVPSPIGNGWFNLPDVAKGTTVEFAIHVGVACHAPGDAAGYRERGELWLNNAGRNFTQVSQ